MFNLKSDHKNGWKVPASWHNRVAAFLTHLAGGVGITITKPDNPSIDTPVMIELDRAGLAKILSDLGIGGGTETTGASGTVTYVSDVVWSNNSLVIKTKTLTVANGLITAIGTAESTKRTITTVTYTP